MQKMKNRRYGVFTVTIVVGLLFEGVCLSADQSLIDQYLRQTLNTVRNFPNIEYNLLNSITVSEETARRESFSDDEARSYNILAEQVIFWGKFYSKQTYLPKTQFPNSNGDEIAWDGKLYQEMESRGDHAYYSFSRNRTAQMYTLIGVPNPFAAFEIFYPSKERRVGVIWPIPSFTEAHLKESNYEVSKIDPSAVLLGKKGLLIEFICKDLDANRIVYQLLHSDRLSKFPNVMVKNNTKTGRREEYIFSSDAASGENSKLAGWMPGKIDFKIFQDDKLVRKCITIINGLKNIETVPNDKFTIDPKRATTILDIDKGVSVNVTN